MPIPKYVSVPQLREALAPLCDLLGVSSASMFSDIKITREAIEFDVPVAFNTDPKGRPVATRVYSPEGTMRPTPSQYEHPHGGRPDPHQVGVGEMAEWAYSVRVRLGMLPTSKDVD